jgi:hypothetical protein
MFRGPSGSLVLPSLVVVDDVFGYDFDIVHIDARVLFWAYRKTRATAIDSADSADGVEMNAVAIHVYALARNIYRR